MTAEEIREAWGDADDLMVRVCAEVAAQLAEFNDHLRFVSCQDKKDDSVAAIRVKVFG